MEELDNGSVIVEEEVVETEVTEVSDADLDAAFQEFIGNTTETEEVVETETVETPVVTHPESSRLGRKVKYMEQNMVSKNEFTQLDRKIDSLLEQLNRKPSEPEYDEYGNVVEKQVDIDSLVDQKLEQRETKKQREAYEASRVYQEGYIANLRELINEIEDPIVARDVFKKMTTPGSEYNVKYSENPYTDVSKNFIKAIKSVQTPFSKKRGASVPTGVTTTTTVSGPVRKMPKLDPEAEEFARLTGMNEDSIMSAHEGEMPSKFRR